MEKSDIFGLVCADIHTHEELKCNFAEMISFNKKKLCSLSRTDQGHIQVRLWGGGEFQLVELMYILVENKI